MILDYNSEEKNFKPALSSEQIKNISKVLAENIAKKDSPNR